MLSMKMSDIINIQKTSVMGDNSADAVVEDKESAEDDLEFNADLAEENITDVKIERTSEDEDKVSPEDEVKEEKTEEVANSSELMIVLRRRIDALESGILQCTKDAKKLANKMRSMLELEEKNIQFRQRQIMNLLTDKILDGLKQIRMLMQVQKMQDIKVQMEEMSRQTNEKLADPISKF